MRNIKLYRKTLEIWDIAREFAQVQYSAVGSFVAENALKEALLLQEWSL